MSETNKRIIAGAVTALFVGSLVWGTYLPYRKSKLYVAAISAGNAAGSFDEFMTPYLKALNATSPIGQEEIVRNFTTTISDLVAGIRTPDPQTLAIVQALGGVLDQYGRPVMERRSATSQVQTYSIFAAAYLRIFDATDVRPFRNNALELLERGLAMSPTRPQMLYLLYEYENSYGSNEEALQYGRRILELWPNDRETSRSVEQLEQR